MNGRDTATSGPWRRIGIEVAAAAAGSLVAAFLLWYLHDSLQLAWAVLCGVVGGVVVRRLVAPAYASFPDFLRGPLELGTVLLGTVLAAWATLVTYPLTYWVLRWRQVVAILAVAAFLGLGLVGLVYTHARMRREVEEARAREAAFREESLRAQLRALQAQINPHFLFNAFNVLAELTHEDPAVAERLVGDLAYLLRYSLRSSAVGMVPLRQELDAVERYLRVERARLGPRLKVRRDVDEETTEWRIPGLVLQPLVENSVQHAVAPRPEGGEIRIVVRRLGAGVRIAVEDDGPGVPRSVRRWIDELGDGGSPAGRGGTAGAGGGLANVQMRLALAYRGAVRLEIEGRESGGALVAMTIPEEADV